MDELINSFRKWTGSLTIVRLRRAHPYGLMTGSQAHPYGLMSRGGYHPPVSGIVYFAILFIYGLALIFFRNHMVTDFNKSFNEAINNQYTDWHPVIFTLIFAKLPIYIVEVLKLPIDLRHATFIFYEFFRALVLALAIFNIEKITNKKIAIISLLYYMFMPLSIHSIVSQTKGTAMGEFFILGFIILLNSIFIKNDDTKYVNDVNNINADIGLNNYKNDIENNKIIIKKIFQDILVGIFFALSLLMRKNGILFFVFVFLGMLFTLPKIKFARIILSLIVTTIIITKVIYSFFNITYMPKSHNTHEMLGLPLTVISAFMKYDEEDVDNDIKEFALELVNNDKSFYDGFNIKIGYNSVRWANGFDTNHTYEVFEKYSAKDVINFAYRLFLKNPKLAMRSIYNLTKGVYGFRNWQGITQQNGKILGKNLFINIYQFFLSLEVAFINLIIIIMIFAKKLYLIFIEEKNDAIDYKTKKILNKKNIFNLCMCLAVLGYNFGTMLLLSSADSTHYFMISSMVLPLIMISVYTKSIDNVGVSLRARF